MPTPIDPPVDWRTERAGKRFDTVIASRLGWTNLAMSNGLLWGWKNNAQWCLPEYSTKTEAAIALFTDTENYAFSFQWGYFRYPDNAKFTFHVSHLTSKAKSITEYADTPALAICKAYLAWKESTE
jgi:hypothetical protein